MDLIERAPEVVKVLTRRYRRQLPRSGKGAVITETGGGELVLTIKDEGVFPFIIYVVRTELQQLKQRIKGILSKEGLPVRERSVGQKPLFDQESWLKAEVAKFTALDGVSDVAAAMAEDFNRQFRKEGQPYVSASVIQNRLQRFHISLAPMSNGGAVDGGEQQKAPPTWDSLREYLREAYLVLRQSTHAPTDDGFWLLEHPTGKLCAAFGPSKGVARYNALKEAGLLAALVEAGKPKVLKLLHIDLPAGIKVPESTVIAPSSQMAGNRRQQSPATRWGLLTPRLQRAYRLLHARVEDVLDDNHWKITGPCAILIERFGESSGKDLYQALKK